MIACTSQVEGNAMGNDSPPEMETGSNSQARWYLPLSSVSGLSDCSSAAGEIEIFTSRIDMDDKANIWLIDDPAILADREQTQPEMRRSIGRQDGMLVHQDGGYLSSKDFSIQCRDIGLMGLNRYFVRCRAVMLNEGVAAGFDIPVQYSGCEGIIARSVIAHIISGERHG
jgi:hypothetical protein